MLKLVLFWHLHVKINPSSLFGDLLTADYWVSCQIPTEPVRMSHTSSVTVGLSQRVGSFAGGEGVDLHRLCCSASVFLRIKYSQVDGRTGVGQSCLFGLPS